MYGVVATNVLLSSIKLMQAPAIIYLFLAASYFSNSNYKLPPLSFSIATSSLLSKSALAFNFVL